MVARWVQRGGKTVMQKRFELNLNPIKSIWIQGHAWKQHSKESGCLDGVELQFCWVYKLTFFWNMCYVSYVILIEHDTVSIWCSYFVVSTCFNRPFLIVEHGLIRFNHVEAPVDSNRGGTFWQLHALQPTHPGEHQGCAQPGVPWMLNPKRP